MVESVTRYRAADGTIHDTADEAEAHETEAAIEARVNEIAERLGVFENSNIYLSRYNDYERYDKSLHFNHGVKTAIRAAINAGLIKLG